MYFPLGVSVGATVGVGVGVAVGFSSGAGIGVAVGVLSEQDSVWGCFGAAVGVTVASGAGVGVAVGVTVIFAASIAFPAAPIIPFDENVAPLTASIPSAV